MAGVFGGSGFGPGVVPALVKKKEKGDASGFPARSIAAVEIVTVYRVRSARGELGVKVRVGPFQAKVPVTTGSMSKAMATDE